MEKQKSDGLGEVANNAIRELDQLQQGFRDWLTVEKPAVEYDAAKCHLSAHLHASAGVPLSEQFCAVFDLRGNGNHFGLESIARMNEVQIDSVEIPDTEIEQSMLIPIPEFVQDIQQVGLIVRPKRLQSLDDCSRGRVNAIDHSQSISVVIPIYALGHSVNLGLGGENWEAGTSPSFDRRNQFPHSMFKCGAHLTYDFPGDDCVTDEKTTGQHGGNDQFIGLRLVLERNAMRLFFPRTIRLQIELLEMVLSPVYLSDGTLERITWHDNSNVQTKSDLELSAERINYEGDLALKNLKGFYNRKSIAEGYRNGVLSLHVHVASIGAYAFEYFSRSAFVVACRGIEGDEGRLSHSDEGDMPMLIGVRDIAQGLCPIDSVVRLVRLDSIYVRARQALEVSVSQPIEIGDGVADRELGAILNRARIVMSQFVDKMVERRSEVMNTVANTQRNGVRESNGRPDSDIGNVPGFVMLDEDSVVLCPPKDFKFADDLVKMFIGAFDPFSSAAERMIVAHG